MGQSAALQMVAEALFDAMGWSGSVPPMLYALKKEHRRIHSFVRR